MDERPRDKWPGPRSKDKQTVTEMLNDPNCHHWSECYQFFERAVKLSRLPVDKREDVVHNAFLTVMTYLHTFRFDSKFSTWLMYILRSRIADAMRELIRANKHILIPGDPPDDDNETDLSAFQDSLSPEEICIAREAVDEVLRAMGEYISKHANRERNMRILLLHFFEQYTIAEIAKELGMKEPAVRAVIIAFKHFVKRSGKQDSAPDSSD